MSRMLFALGLSMVATGLMHMAFDAHNWPLTVLCAGGWASVAYWIGASGPAHDMIDAALQKTPQTVEADPG